MRSTKYFLKGKKAQARWYLTHSLIRKVIHFNWIKKEWKKI